MTLPVGQEEKCFLDAIRAEPEAEVHRLVYADWLEEHDLRLYLSRLIRADAEYTLVGSYEGEWRVMSDAVPPYSWWRSDAIEVLDMIPRMEPYRRCRDLTAFHFRGGFLRRVDSTAIRFFTDLAYSVADQPVQDVRLLNYRPHSQRNIVYVDNITWNRGARPIELESVYLPPVFKSLLVSGSARNDYGDRQYTTAAEAVADVNQACVAYLRRLCKKDKSATS